MTIPVGEVDSREMIFIDEKVLSFSSHVAFTNKCPILEIYPVF
jgi:hypothetical protein